MTDLYPGDPGHQNFSERDLEINIAVPRKEYRALRELLTQVGIYLDVQLRAAVPMYEKYLKGTRIWKAYEAAVRAAEGKEPQ